MKKSKKRKIKSEKLAALGTGNPTGSFGRSGVWDWGNLGFEVLVLAVIIGYCLMVWWPTRYLPYYWDSASFVALGARDLLERNFNPLVLEAVGSAHQPLYMVLLALGWKWWGVTRLVAHQVIAPVLPLLMFATYQLGKRMDSRLVGVTAAFMVGLMPVVVGAYGVLSVDLLLAGLTTLSLALYVDNRKIAAMVLLALAVWVKGTAVLLVPTIVAWEYYNGKLNKQTGYLLAVPVIAILGWFGYHLRVTGWWMAPPEMPLTWPQNLGQYTTYLIYVVRTELFSHWRWLLTGPAIAAGVWWGMKKGTKIEELKPVVALLPTILLVSMWVAARGNYTEANSLMIMPLLVVASLLIVKQVLIESRAYNWEKGLLILGVIASLGWLTRWQPQVVPAVAYDFGQRADLTYQDMLMVERQASTFLEINFPNAKIYGGYPELFELADPFFGYVTTALNVVPCSQYQPSEESVILYLHPYHPSQQACRQLLDAMSVTPIQRFESNGMWVEMYEGVATGSAQTK